MSSKYFEKINKYVDDNGNQFFFTVQEGSYKYIKE